MRAGKRVAAVVLPLALLAAALAWIAVRPPWAVDGDKERGAEPLRAPPSPVTDAPGLALAGMSSADAAAGDEPPTRDEADAQDEPAVSVTLRLTTVDATTGRPVPSTWNLGSGEIVAGPFAPGQTVDDAAIAASEAGLRESVATDQARFRPSGEVHPRDFRDGESVGMPLRVRPSSGWVRAEEQPNLAFTLAAGVREARATYPLWREAVLDVRVLDPEGRPARGARLVGLEVAGEIRKVDVEDRGPGEIRIRGIPSFPGEPVRAAIDWGRTEEEEDDRIPTPSEGVPSPELETTVPAEATSPWTEIVRLQRPTGPRLFDHNEVDFDLPFEESLGEAGITDDRTGAVHLRVVGWDGAPMRGVDVEGATTDRAGEVVLREEPVGERWFGVAADGHFPASALAIVSAGRETEVVLREPVGARLVVTVTDEEGRPRPSARVEIPGALVFDVVDGVQRVDTFTDPLGRRAFARVQPGEWKVTATWGSRRGSEKVVLQDGERAAIRIVAK